MEESRWPNLRYCPSTLTGKTDENEDKFDIRFRSLGLDLEIPEHKAINFPLIYLVKQMDVTQFYYDKNKRCYCVISGVSHGVNAIFALLGCYRA
jgi:hypothetical protein